MRAVLGLAALAAVGLSVPAQAAEIFPINDASYQLFVGEAGSAISLDPTFPNPTQIILNADDRDLIRIFDGNSQAGEIIEFFIDGVSIGFNSLQYVVTGRQVLTGRVIAAPNGPTTFGLNFAAVVPEPATWAFMVIGFGAIGATMRKRKQVRVTYA